MAGNRHYITPFVLPVAAFAAAVGVGALLLYWNAYGSGTPVSFVDALFTVTSAVCVTGLASVDVFTVFDRAGQSIVLVLMQLGGIGIVTYTTLVFYMLGKRISLRDRLAVEQGLLYDPTFHLGRFIQRMVLAVLLLEALGVAALYCLEPERIGLFNALFLAVSSFCNAGFAPWADSLVQWRGHWGVNTTVMLLITLGGIGYFVAEDLFRVLRARLSRLLRPRRAPYPLDPYPHEAVCALRLSHYSRVVLATSFFLVIGGTAAVFLLEAGNAAWNGLPLDERFLMALFQSVTSRTAGFATVDMSMMTDAALLVTVVLMVIGGSPGSCAGGIKTTTFRILWGMMVSRLRGHGQAVVADRAVPVGIAGKAMLLFCYALLTILAATLTLLLTENGSTHHGAAPFGFLDLFFEVVSAFGTVGLSINVTPRLTEAGKIVLCVVMFIGKLGPVWLVTTIQQFQAEPAYRYPEDPMPVG